MVSLARLRTLLEMRCNLFDWSQSEYQHERTVILGYKVNKVFYENGELNIKMYTTKIRLEFINHR